MIDCIHKQSFNKLFDTNYTVVRRSWSRMKNTYTDFFFKFQQECCLNEVYSGLLYLLMSWIYISPFHHVYPAS